MVMKSQRFFHIRTLYTSLLLIALGAILVGCQTGTPLDNTEEDRPVPVQVQKIVQEDLIQEQKLVGIVKASTEINIVPKLAAKVLAIHVEEGDAVTEGQLLAELDGKDVQRALEMERMSLSISENQLASAQSRLRQMEAAAKEIISHGGEIDDQTEENIRQSVLAVEQAQMNVEMTRLRVEQAEEQLKDTKIYAITDGVIANVGATSGEMVSPQMPLFTIVSNDPLLLEVNVSPDKLALFARGEEVTVYLPTQDKRTTGIVSSISPVASPTGLYPVEVEIAKIEGVDIRPGTAAQVIFPQILAHNALLVPTEAVIEQGGESYIYIVRDNTAVQVPIEIVRAQTDLTAVEGDLSEGDVVVTKGHLTLNDGKSVSIIEEGN